MIGKTLSHYKVLEKIGQGGMGEVYRAEDTNLSREVAIKVLPEQFTQDPQRLARFEREAKLLASLNHPNIAAIYGLEEADGVRFLTLELVPGDTLAERVAKGPVPVEEALEVCRQIAEGVEAAHEKGVIHRDLKPANVKVTPEGKVKILDFGLAKAFEAEPPVTDISQSPTLTEEMTKAGVILGTAAYMSPEQAKGQPVDKRTDIFAFGCVLYELLTAKRAFAGDTITETIASVLKSEPAWEVLPEGAPWRALDLLRQCFEKDLRERLQHIGDARIQINRALTEPEPVSPTGPTTQVPTARWRSATTVGLVVVTVLTMGLLVWSLTRQVPLTEQSLTRWIVGLPPARQLVLNFYQGIALSPDGQSLVYAVEGSDGLPELYLRPLDQLEARPLSGTKSSSGLGFGGATSFFSPDGQWVGFFADLQLKKVSVEGGVPVVVCNVPDYGYGASWGLDDHIILGNRTAGLTSVPASGGEPQALTTPNRENGEVGHTWPSFPPGGETLLFTIETDKGPRIGVLNLKTREWQQLSDLGEASQPRYVATGHLLYAQSGGVWVLPFDLARVEPRGSPTLMVKDVYTDPIYGAHFALSDNGTLVYVPGGAGERRLVWVDRDGQATPLPQEPSRYQSVRLSPDGTRVVFDIADRGGRDIWVDEIDRGTRTRLTDGGTSFNPIWTPDGRHITFSFGRAKNGGDLYRIPVDRSGLQEPLLTGTTPKSPSSWSPDGRSLAFYGSNPSLDIGVLADKDDAAPVDLLATPYHERTPMFSPDGHWLAYVSSQTGSGEVYLQPYPGPGSKTLISTGGGFEPLWSSDGRELFYRQGNGERMIAVAVETHPQLKVGKPRLLFEGPYFARRGGFPTSYDVSPDGRFLMIRSDPDSTPTHFNVILNWFEELQRLVPTGK